YQPTLLYASGKTGLKSFSKVELAGGVHTLQGQALFAGFYLNELLVRLLPLEEPCPELLAAYGVALAGLTLLAQQPDASHALLCILRRFEWVLLQTLGYALRFDVDDRGECIDANQFYLYQAGVGFVRHAHGEVGQQLLNMGDPQQVEQPAQVAVLTRTFRREIAAQLGEQPLRSRELWLAAR
ncbi:MAG: repair protein RecO, partial [Pseudomonadota bacterium]